MDLAFREQGDGSPLILLHGLLGSSTNLGSVARAMASVCRVISPDLRNHGDSPRANAMSYDAMADDVIALMDRLHIERAAILGHSMGGKTAMILALRYPERVSRILVADIAPVSYPLRNQDILQAMAAVDLSELKDRASADMALQAQIDNPGVRAFVLTNLVKQDDAWAWRVNLLVLQAELPTICGFPDVMKLPPFDGPAWFVYGTQSDYVLPEYEAIIRQHFSHVTMKSLEAGHWLHAEKPVEFNALVGQWFGD